MGAFDAQSNARDAWEAPMQEKRNDNSCPINRIFQWCLKWASADDSLGILTNNEAFRFLR